MWNKAQENDYWKTMKHMKVRNIKTIQRKRTRQAINVSTMQSILLIDIIINKVKQKNLIMLIAGLRDN